MKKISATFFLTLLLVTQTPAQQLLKLPILVEHLREHRREDPKISFFSFIKLHYFSGNPKDADYDRDQQLPFRAEGMILTGGAIEVPGNIVVLEEIPRPAHHSSWPLFDITWFSSSHRLDIWQPPKSC